MKKSTLVGSVFAIIVTIGLITTALVFHRRDKQSCPELAVSINLLSGVVIEPWRITGEKACQVQEMLAVAPIMPTFKTTTQDAMGYRGFVVESTINQSLYHASILDGSIIEEIHGAIAVKQDIDQNLEIILLESGVSAGRVTPELAEKMKDIYRKN